MRKTLNYQKYYENMIWIKFTIFYVELSKSILHIKCVKALKKVIKIAFIEKRTLTCLLLSHSLKLYREITVLKKLSFRQFFNVLLVVPGMIIIYKTRLKKILEP